MRNTIAEVFYWKGLERDVQGFVDGCMKCLKAKHPMVRYGKLPPKTVEEWPWFEVAVDSIGSYGPQKFRALSIMDTATRLLELVPADDANSVEAAYLFDRHWLCRYPRPTRCIHDGGTNAVIERVHRIIGEKMRKQDIKSTQQWESFLHNTTFAIRSAHHSMTKASPAQLAFGRDMFVDIAHTTDWETAHQRKVVQVRAHNDRENRGRAEWTYRPGDKVLLRRDADVQSKMLRLFDGPYKIVALQEHGTITLDKGRYVETVSIRRVRPCKRERGGDCEASTHCG
eukprot:jgi/Phyca11/128981/e_gw1.80.113.1